MSQSSPSGERSSVTSPRHPYPASISNSVSSRPGTAGTTKIDGHVAQNSTVPVSSSDSTSRHSEYLKGSPELASQTPSRPFGVHSILNHPAEGNQKSPTSKYLPSLGQSIGQSLLPPPALSPRSRKRTDASSPTRESDSQNAHSSGRRVLTPKSPGLRAASLGVRRNPTYHGSNGPFQHLPGPEPRIYTAEPGVADIPSLPPLSLATRVPRSETHPTDYSTDYSAYSRPPRAAPTQMRPVPHSARDNDGSPESVYGHMSQSRQSSSFRYGPPSSTSHPVPDAYRNIPGGMQGGYVPDQHAHGPHDGYQAGPGQYQMTLNTDDGPMVVPVEVDVQQASKVADEKRKRNAGASARFRARRKEKEKEASKTISGLQHELRMLSEARDFYRNERNVFRDIAARSIGTAQLPPRPPSPAYSRSRTPSIGAADTSRSFDDDYRDRSESVSTIRRRRTGDYQPHYMHEEHSPRMPSYGTGYAFQPTLPLPQQQQMGSGPYASPRSLPPGPPPQSIRAQSYDPFRKDPYDRSWNPGR